MAHNSYTMSTRGLPDMYTLSPLACGPRASGIHIRQTTRVHGITIRCTELGKLLHITSYFQTKNYLKVTYYVLYLKSNFII